MVLHALDALVSARRMTDVAVASLPSALRESKASSRVGAGDARDAVVSRHELAVFRSWLKQQPHLPQDIPDDMLMMFLHSQDHLLERAKAVLDRSYTIRTYATDIFSDRNPLLPELQNVFSIGYFGPLPRACPDGVMPVVCAIKDADPNKFNFVHCVKIALMVADFTIIRNGPVGGYRLILDMRGASIGHLAKVNFAAMKHGLDYQQEGLPVKLKGVHVINASALIHQIMVLVKPLLNQKSREMLHVHTEAQMPKFYDQYCPQALMPKDYGGDSPCLEDLNNMVKRGVENLAPWYREEERLRVNESLRPSRSRGSYTSPESFGCNGSFKKLNLD